MNRPSAQARVFVGNMPRLLRDIVGDLVQSQRDMEIVGRGEHADVAAALKRYTVDVVVMGARPTSSIAAHESRTRADSELKIAIVACPSGKPA